MELGVRDVYQYFNMLELQEIDHTYCDRAKYINSLAVSDRIIPFLEGLALYEINEIMRSDHRSYVIDLNLEVYFEEQFS